MQGNNATGNGPPLREAMFSLVDLVAIAAASCPLYFYLYGYLVREELKRTKYTESE